MPAAENCCVAPAGADEFWGEIAMAVTPLADPKPARDAVCGLLFALSVTVSVPLMVPPLESAIQVSTFPSVDFRGSS